MSTSQPVSAVQTCKNNIETTETELRTLQETLDKGQDILRQHGIFKNTVQDHIRGRQVQVQRSCEAAQPYNFGASFAEEITNTHNTFRRKAEESLNNMEFKIKRHIIETEDQITAKKKALDTLEDKLTREIRKQKQEDKTQ